MNSINGPQQGPSWPSHLKGSLWAVGVQHVCHPDLGVLGNTASLCPLFPGQEPPSTAISGGMDTPIKGHSTASCFPWKLSFRPIVSIPDQSRMRASCKWPQRQATFSLAEEAGRESHLHSYLWFARRYILFPNKEALLFPCKMTHEGRLRICVFASCFMSAFKLLVPG